VQKLIAAAVERDPSGRQHRADVELGPCRSRAKKKKQ
jgi:hypothetical protein